MNDDLPEPEPEPQPEPQSGAAASLNRPGQRAHPSAQRLT